jgi:lysophospholipase L1-like esterase
MRRAVLVLLLGLASACHDHRAEPRHPLIVVLGSSTAAGHGLADPKTSWVNRYAALLATQSIDLTNLAVGGYSTYQIQPTGTVNPADRPAVEPEHNITAALELHPSAIVVNLPSNDAAMSVPVADSLANIAKVASLARDAHVPIWVTTSQPRQLPPDGVKAIVEYREQILKIYGDHALDFFTPLATPDALPIPALNQGDGIHPNAEGHRLLFEQVRAANLPAIVPR